MDSKLTEIPTEEVVIYPYSSSRRVTYLFSTPDTSDPSPLRGTPTPRDPSLYFTIARVLITRSFNLFPVCDPDLIQDRETFGLPGMFYYHTHVLQVLQALIDGRCAIEKREGRVVVWYEVGEKEVEVERANERMRRYRVQVHKQTLSDDQIPVKQQLLNKDCLLVILGGHLDPEWSLLQSSIILGQLGLPPQRFHLLTSLTPSSVPDLPTSNLKLCLLAGSFHSDTTTSSSQEEDLLTAFIEANPHIHYFAFGAGTRLLARVLGCQVHAVSDQTFRFIGRRMSVMPFSQKGMALQHIDGPVVAGEREYIGGERKIGLVSARPDYNQAFMQEQVLPMYFKKNIITPDFYSKSYLECQRDFQDEDDDNPHLQTDDLQIVWSWIRAWAKLDD